MINVDNVSSIPIYIIICEDCPTSPNDQGSHEED